MAHDPNSGWQEVTAAHARDGIAAPSPEDHKYRRGVVLLATGSPTFPGAAVLTAEAAGRAGAGMLRYTGPDNVAHAVLAARPEAVRGLGQSNALVIGSGIPDAREDERGTLVYSTKFPVIADAGALPLVKPGQQNLVITPHAGELERLLDRLEIAKLSREEIEANPAEAAVFAAEALRCTVLLKGHVTHVVRGAERFRVTSPTSWLATAGTGDVLAGLLGTVLAARHARGEESSTAAAVAAAVWLHGRAGWLAAQRNAAKSPSRKKILAAGPELEREGVGGPILASDVAAAIPAVIAAVLAR